jgi:hypothetical protein
MTFFFLNFLQNCGNDVSLSRKLQADNKAFLYFLEEKLKPAYVSLNIHVFSIVLSAVCTNISCQWSHMKYVAVYCIFSAVQRFRGIYIMFDLSNVLSVATALTLLIFFMP